MPKTHMTLGGMIDALQEIVQCNRHTTPVALHYPHSYRGYYHQLAFELAEESDQMELVDFVDMVHQCEGREFTGYKGGDFIMRSDTPLWVAYYGSCGKPILDLKVEDGCVVAVIDENYKNF